MKINFKLSMFLTIFMIFIFSLSISNTSALSDPYPQGPPPGAPSSFSSLKKNLNQYHNGWLPESILAPGLKFYNMNGSGYLSRGIVYYGNHKNVPGNTFLRGHYRYSGLSSDGVSPFPNWNFIDDFLTYGDTGTRAYEYNFWKSGKKPYSLIVGSGSYNDPTYVALMYYSSTGKSVNGQGRIDFWLEGTYDQYARAHDYWNKYSPYFKRKDNIDQFSIMTPQKRRGIVYIAMPPTNFTRGLGVTVFKSNVSASGYLYDTHMIQAFLERDGVVPDFKADKLKANKINNFTYELNFSAKNISDINVNNSVPSSYKYKIGNGSWKTVEGVYHNMNWSKNRLNSASLGQIVIPAGTPSGTKVEIVAEINPVLKSTGKRYIDEDITNNNVIKTSFYTSETNSCATGGLGTTDNYGLKVCSSWATNSEGYTFCNATVNQYIPYSLSNVATVDYISEKQTLTGTWSRTGDHLNANKSTPYIEGAKVDQDRFDYSYRNGKLNGISNLLDYGISPDLVKSVGELGIGKKDIKKVMRAGRPVQMYGTIKVDLSLSSFKGSGDLNSKKDKFMKELVNSLESKGIKVSGGPSAIKNNKGDTVVVAKLDKDRKNTTIDGKKYTFKNNPEGYMYKSEGKMTKTTYGDSSVKKLDVYRKNYSFIIPVETFNVGGEQETNQGSLGNDYNIGNDESSFYTNINTPDGLHGLAFGLKMDRKSLDPVFSGHQYCVSPTERFEIKGNIYDDIRSEDEKDVDFGDHDDEWDF